MIYLKFAVLVTTYNGADTIKASIDGIKSCILKISYPIDVYVYDDCSLDDTIEIINNTWSLPKEKLIIIKNEKNLGLFQNKNKALQHLADKYDWIFLMDQDDYPYENWALTLVQIIDKYAKDDTFIVWSSYDEYDHNTSTLITSGETTDKISIIIPTPEKLRKYIKNIYTSYCISGSALNTKLIKKMDFFNAQYNHFGDTDFFIRGMLNGFNHIYIGTALLVRGISISQASSVHKKSFKDIHEMDRYYKRFSKYLTKRHKFLFSKYLFFISFKRLGKELLDFKFKRAFSLFRYTAKLGLHVLKSYL